MEYPRRVTGRILPVVALAALASCRSSAPYTVPSAAINLAAAAATSLGQRATGGCYAVCVGGTACNAATGTCEPIAEFRCIGTETASPICSQAGPTMSTSQAVQLPGALTPVLGVSPATGSVPPPPAEASPRPP
jgi:hypothetical protein